MTETRDELLKAATQAVAEQGFDKANVNQIADAAGFSVGTLYNHFPTKRDLMHTIIVEISQLHRNAIVEKVMQTEDPIKRIEFFFEAGFTFVESNLIQAKAIFNTLNGPDAEFKYRLFHAYQPIFELLRKDILELGISKEIFYHINPEHIANLIMLIYLGAGSQFNNEGKLWVNSKEVSKFVLNSLLYKGKDG